MFRKTLLSCIVWCSTIIAIAQGSGYYFNSWITVVNITADNNWHFSEEYDVFFNESSRGIYRYIQNEFGCRRNLSEDDQDPNVRYRIYHPDVEVLSAEGAETFIDPSDANNCTLIRWGSIDKWITGQHSYSLKYDYQYPDDRIKARDYLYHTLIPSDVTAQIRCFRFVINSELPFPADIADKLAIYKGEEFSDNKATVQDLKVTSNCISGTILDLTPGECVTIYAELPDGFFSAPTSASSAPMWLFFALTLLLGFMMLYYELFRSSPKPVKTVEFYPPKGMTPLMVGKFLDDKMDDIDISATLPWLAEQGYISITETGKGEKKYSGRNAKRIKELESQNDEDEDNGEKDYKIRDLQTLPDDVDPSTKYLMQMLFQKSSTQIMSKMNLGYSAYNKLQKSVDETFRGDKALYTRHHPKLMMAYFAIGALCLLFSSPITYFYIDNAGAGAIWLCTGLIAWVLRMSNADRDLFRKRILRITFVVLRICAFLFVALMVYVLLMRDQDCFLSNNQLLLFFGLGLIVCELSGRNMHNTAYRIEVAGKLMGLHEFIKTAEKERLEMLVDQDPEYFYKILPYAMIFGLTDKWGDLFSSNNITIPQQPNMSFSRRTDDTSSLINASQFTQMANNLGTGIRTSGFNHASHRSGGKSSGSSWSSSGSSWSSRSSSSSSWSSGGYSGGSGGGGGAGRW